MKKLISVLALTTTISSANALSIGNYIGVPRTHYQNGYEAGYSAGKSHAYNKAAKAIFFTGFTVIAGVIIYQLGKESRWTTNENGVVYRF